MSEKPIAIAADHAGYLLKEAVRAWLEACGVAVRDYGTEDEASVDYPDYASRVVEAIEDGSSECGILVCGSGVGMSIAANRHAAIRAALVHDPEAARMARQHNDANVLVLAGRMIDAETGRRCVEAFLETPFEGGRHQRRLDKIR